MKAAVQDRYGGPEVLEFRDVPQPELASDRVLVRVEAAAVNPLDWHYLRAKPFLVRFSAGLRRPKQPIRGVDLAGRVEAVGSEVTLFEKGDSVFGSASGAFAEYVTGKEDQFLPIPGNLTAEQAAAVPVAAITALQGLRDHGRLQPDQSVMIIGAGGGVGTFAVQIAKALGATVTAVCSTSKVDLVRSLGADDVIDYTRHALSGDHDLIFQVAGTASPRSLRRLLVPQGSLVLCSGDGLFSGIDRIVSGLVLSRFVDQRLVGFLADETVEDLRTISEMLESEAVTPVIDRTFPLARAADAIRYLEEGHARGKVIVTI